MSSVYRTCPLSFGMTALLLASLASACDQGGAPRDGDVSRGDAGSALDADDLGTPDARDDQPRPDDATNPPDGVEDSQGEDADAVARDAGDVADPLAELRSALAPTPCLAAVFPGELPLDSAALRAVPAEVRRWSPLTALLQVAGLPDVDDDAGAALRAARATAAENARACVDANCVRTELEYTTAQVDALAEWLAVHRAALVEANAGLGLTPSPDASFADREWAVAVAAHHAEALSAGLRLALEGLDEDELIGALNGAIPLESGANDAGAADLVARLARASGNDEAVRYEPHLEGQNAAALARLATIDPDAWPYAAILVPGQGPTELDTPISPLSVERVDLALERLRAGLAPFVLVSGGHVHPSGTPYSEAIEMKRRLMEVHGVPEEQILVDPWARHTTTNLRNAARVLAHLGVDLERPVLVTSDPFQSVYIVHGITQRSIDELGYVPWRTMTALSANDACVILTRSSLRVDPSDPRDP